MASPKELGELTARRQQESRPAVLVLRLKVGGLGFRV